MRAPPARAAPHSSTSTETDIVELKAALRAVASTARRGLDGVAAGVAIGERLLESGLVAPGMAIAGVWPLPGEVDLRPLLATLHISGHVVLLPETPPRGRPLIFRRWQPGATMIAERFGTERPDGEERKPDLLLVPLLAFDRRGYRLGYGGGYYDRTLEGLPGRRAVGFAFAAQEVDAVPVEPHDQPLDAVITERDAILISPAACATI